MYTKKVLQYHYDVRNDARSDYCEARRRAWYKLVEVVWEEGAPDQTEQQIGGNLRCDWCYLYAHENPLEGRGRNAQDQENAMQ